MFQSSFYRAKLNHSKISFAISFPVSHQYTIFFPIRFSSQIKKHNIHILRKCCLSKSPPQFQANWIGYIRLLWIHCLPAISSWTCINKWNFRSLVFTFIVHYIINLIWKWVITFDETLTSYFITVYDLWVIAIFGTLQLLNSNSLFCYSCIKRR